MRSVLRFFSNEYTTHTKLQKLFTLFLRLRSWKNRPGKQITAPSSAIRNDAQTTNDRGATFFPAAFLTSAVLTLCYVGMIARGPLIERFSIIYPRYNCIINGFVLFMSAYVRSISCEMSG